MSSIRRFIFTSCRRFFSPYLRVVWVKITIEGTRIIWHQFVLPTFAVNSCYVIIAVLWRPSLYRRCLIYFKSSLVLRICRSIARFLWFIKNYEKKLSYFFDKISWIFSPKKKKQLLKRHFHYYCFFQFKKVKEILKVSFCHISRPAAPPKGIVTFSFSSIAVVERNLRGSITGWWSSLWSSGPDGSPEFLGSNPA